MKIDVSTKTCTSLFIAVLFIIVEKCKHPKCPSTGDCINKMWYIHTIDCYYLALERNEVLIHTITWTTLENIILTERRQSLGYI